MGLFFMTVGMSLNFPLLFEKLPYIVLISLALILGKTVIVAVLCRFFRTSMGIALQTGLLLAQGSEFAFVLFSMASIHQILDTEISQMMLVVVTLTMALTPLLSAGGKKLVRILDMRNPVHLEPKDLTQETLDLENHTIVVGFGRCGQTICSLLETEEIKYIAVDSDPKHVHRGRKNGFPVYYGKVDKIDILQSIGIERANTVAVTVDERKDAITVVSTIHQYYPDMPIIARARDRKHANELRDVGADIALAELFESSLMLGSSLLRKSGIPEFEIGRVIEKFREEEDPTSQYQKFSPASQTTAKK